jgi:hypothetical protein
MNATRLVIATRIMGVLFLVAAGCSRNGVPPPGVKYSVSAITKGKDGSIRQEEPEAVVGSAAATDPKEVAYEGHTILVRVRKTQYGKATFEVTFPDNSSQMVQVRSGETKDILARGQRTGVRIQVQDSH